MPVTSALKETDGSQELNGQPAQPASLPARKGELRKRTLAQGSKVESISRRHLDVLASACVCNGSHTHILMGIYNTHIKYTHAKGFCIPESIPLEIKSSKNSGTFSRYKNNDTLFQTVWQQHIFHTGSTDKKLTNHKCTWPNKRQETMNFSYPKAVWAWCFTFVILALGGRNSSRPAQSSQQNLFKYIRACVYYIYVLHMSSRVFRNMKV